MNSEASPLRFARISELANGALLIKKIDLCQEYNVYLRNLSYCRLYFNCFFYIFALSKDNLLNNLNNYIMRKVYVICDAAGWMSDYFFTSRRKVIECLNRMIEVSANIYDLPLSVHVLEAYCL